MKNLQGPRLLAPLQGFADRLIFYIAKTHGSQRGSYDGVYEPVTAGRLAPARVTKGRPLQGTVKRLQQRANLQTPIRGRGVRLACS